MAKCEICFENNGSRTISGMGMCDNCFNYINKVRNGDKETMKYMSSHSVLDKCSDKARIYIINTLNSAEEKYGKIEEWELEKQREFEAEKEKQSFATSRLGLYEYDVVTVLNEDHGRVDTKSMTGLINKRAQEGWRLHTVYSNELGKNAIHVLGLGVNSTACEDVLIFERKLMD